jgi:nitrate/nitrite-specific signal transduction histidine kinase
MWFWQIRLEIVMKFNFSIGQRIGLGFSLLILLALLAISLGFLLAGSLEATLATTQAGSLSIQTLGNLERQKVSMAATVDRMLLTQQTDPLNQSLQGNAETFNEELNNLLTQSTVVDSANSAPVRDNFQVIGNEFNELVDEIASLAEDGRWVQAQTLRETEMTAVQRQFDDALQEFNNLLAAEITTSINEAVRYQTVLRTYGILFTFLFIVGGGTIAYFTGRSITQPVRALTGQLKQLSQQNFSDIVPLNRQDEIGELSQNVVLVSSWLRQSYEELELRVVQRTQALQASSKISLSLSNILDLDKLVSQVVKQIQTAFAYYHVHIYLFDETKEKLVMMGGTGEAGVAMLAANHSLLPDQGLVGRSASSREIIHIPDVHAAPDWLPNPLLPDTQAEIAVPISLADRVLGVLDVQHNVVNGLTQMDVELLQNIANQVAIAVQNARSYRQVQAQREVEAMAGKINQKIQLATSVEDVLQVAARELATALALPKVEVALQNSQHKPDDRLN